jgi:hypothetical protein
MTAARLILHIGTQKTGSSSLQKTMRDARERLLQAGILYPLLERGKHRFKHAGMTRAAKSERPDEAAAEHAALVQEFQASGAHTMVLSDEALWRAQTPFRQFFERFRPDFRVEVVAYLRRPDLYIESLYNQTFRTGDPSEHRTIGAFWRDPAVLGRILYHQRLAEWQSVADEVRVFDFSREVKAHGLIASFFEGLGLQVSPLPQEITAKASPDSQAVLTLRCLRAAGLPTQDELILAAAEQVAALPDAPAPVKHLLGRLERQALLGACQDDLAALQRDFGIQFASDLPSENDLPMDQPTEDYLIRLLSRLSQAEGLPATHADRKARRRDKIKGW